MNLNPTSKNLICLNTSDLDVFNQLKMELILFNISRQENYSLVHFFDNFNILDLYFYYGIYKLNLPKYYYLYLFNYKLEYIGTFRFLFLNDINILDFCKK